MGTTDLKFGKNEAGVVVAANSIDANQDQTEIKMGQTNAQATFTQEKKARRSGATKGTQYLVLQNSADKLVGQVVSNGYTPSFSAPLANPVTMSIKKAASIPDLCTSCTKAARVAKSTASGTKIVYSSGTTPLAVTQNGDTWSFSTKTPATYYLAYEFTGACACKELTAATSTLKTANAKTTRVGATLTFAGLTVAQFTPTVKTKFKEIVAAQVGANKNDVTITSVDAK